MVDEIQAQVQQIVDQSKDMEKRSALIIEFLGDSIYTYDKTTLGGDMAITVGADLLDTPEQTIGLEDLIELDPQVIFVVYMDGDEEGMAEKSVANVTGNEALSSLTAVKTATSMPSRWEICIPAPCALPTGLRFLPTDCIRNWQSRNG